jgi:hypothetical protein
LLTRYEQCLLGRHASAPQSNCIRRKHLTRFVTWTVEAQWIEYRLLLLLLLLLLVLLLLLLSTTSCVDYCGKGGSRPLVHFLHSPVVARVAKILTF